MQYDRVVSLSNGTCIKIDNSLKSSVTSITFELEINKKYEDHISIFNERETNIDGNVYSDNNRIIVKNPIINATACDIALEINTSNLQDGEKLIGTISIVSNVGTLDIPYEYKIISNNLKKTILELKQVIDFYDFLTKDFEAAKDLFFDKDFLKAPFMNDMFTLGLYNSLLQGSNNNIAMIEFFKAFELDISKYFVEDEEISNKYIDETLDNIDISTIKKSKTLGEMLSADTKEDIYEVNDEIYAEASYLIEELRDRELLNVLASMCVRNNYINEIAFKIYLKVIEKGSNIPGIYDKFLLSIPDSYNYRLPLYIYRYYFDDRSYTFDDKSKLYENIIAAFEENEDVYSMYSNEIREYAITRIYQNRITESLVKIYNKVLNKNIINENNCNNVLYLIRSHKIILNNKKIRKIVIRYAETEKETKYDVINGIAYVPIFFDSYIMLYEDVYGNRFYSEEVSIKNLFNMRDLEKYIIENFPQKEIIDMTKLIKLNETETFTKDYEIAEVMELDNVMKISPAIRSKFRNKIIEYYFILAVEGNQVEEETVTYLKQLPFSQLDIFSQRKILKILLNSNEFIYVYDKVLTYGVNLLEDADLVNLFSKCIDYNDYDKKRALLNDVFNFVKSGNRDHKLCTYLGNNYEGSIKNMVFVMNVLVSINLDPSYIAKRIIMNCLESSDVAYLDEAYSYYDVNNDSNDNIKIAYLNKKATDYVLDDKESDETYFDNLVRYMSDNYDHIEDMPIIFLLAITKYISTFKILSNNDYRRILIKSMERLLKLDYVFAYFKKLNRHMQMPYSIMNKEYIEYHADKDFVPKAILSISGDNEKKEVELSKVFMNIYVKKITVFKNEVINYDVINGSDNSSGVLASGSLKYDENYEFEYPKSGKVRTTFDFINDAIVNLDRDNIEGLKKVVMEMKEKQEISKQLFNI